MTKADVRSFLGLVGYYRKFIPNFLSIAAPLSDLTKKGAPTRVNWTSNCESAFRSLKEVLLLLPVLVNPDWDKPFILQTDASDRGIAGVLSQVDANGEEHPIVYLSRKLLPPEVAYSTIEKEFLALVWSVQELDKYQSQVDKAATFRDDACVPRLDAAKLLSMIISSKEMNATQSVAGTSAFT